MTSVINSAIPFFLLPVLTRYLSPVDYGIVSMFGMLVSFIAPFTGLSVHGAIARMYYEKDTVDIKEYITNSIYILISSTLLVAVIFFMFSSAIANVSSVPIQVLWMVIVVSFAQFITKIVLTLWQVQVKSIQYGVYQISQTALNMLLSIVLVVFVDLTWSGRVYAQVVSLMIFVLISFFILIKNNWLKFSYNKTYIKHALGFGVPLIPHALGGVLMTMTDRIFITNMVGIETTGVYTVGYQIGMIINLLATSFNQAYVPWLYSKLKENIMATKKRVVKFTYLYFIIILLMSVVLSLIAPSFLSFFVGREFGNSSIYVTWIALGYAFNGMYFMIGSYIFYAEKTSYLAWVTFTAAVLNIGLNYVLISKYGAIGAAMATTLIYFIKFILTWILSSKAYKMPWNILKDLKK
ncbi:O-antigen/teichoic acid export membrane protein [Streptohalobacillus salinus]|uniref:O-antigen/teichoic acid export membrane protein n=2 Tax=Streptohalobacillus salinus TaxID=621096 RepID=A0A2V3WT62_9BACI|nr:O-antigen/teichoic acid export membrane protein [Streptohalobacillus salinus]